MSDKPSCPASGPCDGDVWALLRMGAESIDAETVRRVLWRLAEAERLLQKCVGDDSKHEMGLYELALNDGPRWTSEADAIRDAVEAFLRGGG